MADPFVQVVDVNKVIQKQKLVDNINLNIDAGSIVGLCGGNGAGKSTVLRMIAGIMQPTSGEISVNRIQWKKDRKQFSQQIGYMPDDFQFSHGLTAAEILSFWAALRRVPQTRVDEVLGIVGLEDKRNEQVHTFSKGMRQRILFAQAMLGKPPLLIMDEPTNGLDPYWMNEFVRLLQKIKSEGHTVLFSTHQLDIAEEVADYVVFLNNGRNYGEGTVEYFREQYGAFPLHTAFQQSLGITSAAGELNE
ncbi:ABC transporter ATP-binding protein [Paenibacillus lentus]|uniref:ABC transporter ATP-binding protein n=1 Tax=Paenibacillus lentus TaxID=1338368 RepID=A0A3Q8SDL6_9BACL|nr:ABC transporter ATP-binding protein [Paenibacillus lentus]AZK48127.1 ABC transporter ATP-binding protein [Paenibacillus lentus]